LSAAGGFKRCHGKEKHFMAIRSKQLKFCLAGLGVLISMGTPAQAQPVPSGRTPLMEQQKEVALALSACPPFVATKASVYVLGKSGYTKIREGENGFTAIVQHSTPANQEPHCMDAEGGRTILPRFLKVAELRAQGKSPADIQRFVADAFVKGVFQPPAHPGIDYMLSTENLVTNAQGEVTHFPPHVMFYGPYMKNADIGADGDHLGSDGNPMGPVFVAGEGGPHALIIVPLGPHNTAKHEAK
jgi:hypothetical protein